MQKRHLSLVGLLLISTSSIAGGEELRRLSYGRKDLVVDLGVGLWAWPLPHDYDGDGDLDLVVSCPDKPYGGVYFFENRDGSAKMPVFEPGVRIGEMRRNPQISFVAGKPRILTPGRLHADFASRALAGGEKLRGTETLKFPPGKTRANQWKLCDYDGDGDQDLIVGQGNWSDYGWDDAFDESGAWTRGPLHGWVYLCRNLGTNESPNYAKPIRIEAEGVPIDVYGMPTPSLADFDGDDDLDIICGEFLDRLTFFENVGSRTAPRYARGRFLEHDGKVIHLDLQMIVPVAIDWDRDGDVDLLVGEEDGRVAFLENRGQGDRGPLFALPRFFRQKAADVKFGALSTPDSFDWDGDGDEDIISGNTAGYIAFIENLDGGDPPSWAPPRYLEAGGETLRIMAGANGSIQGPCEAKWGYTTLSVGDWDGDDLPDIVVNSIWGKILWYRNIGTRTEPRLAAARPIEVEWKGATPGPAWNWWSPKGKNLVTQWRTRPCLVDWNRDGLVDLIMLDHDGFLALFERFEVEGQRRLRPGRRIFLDTKGQPLRPSRGNAGKSGRRKLAFADWNGDGKLDLILNDKNAELWLQVGAVGSGFSFEKKGLMDTRILAGHTTSPCIMDWDKNGIPDLLIGAEDGYFYAKKNPRSEK